MSGKLFSRRRFTVTAASVGLASVAGCSGSGDSSADESTTEASTDTQTTSGSTETATETATETTIATGEPDDEVSDGVIETLADYKYVAERPDEFVGTQISCDGLDGDLRYYNQYGEDYQGFRALFDAGTRPFMIKTDESFTDTARIEFTGTVEKIGAIQDTPVIFVEDATIEAWRND